jgi:hypothetical protein
MTAILKINKGTAEKLLQWTEIKPNQSRDLSGKELTLEIENNELIIERHKEDYGEILEISDLNGSFGVWIQLTIENVRKLKGILDMGS